jgi:hypothetical protein
MIIAKLNPSPSWQAKWYFQLIEPPINQPTPAPEKFIFQYFLMNVDQVTLQEYSTIQIERRPQVFVNWKTT